MQSSILLSFLVLATIAVFSAHAFTSQVTNGRETSTALFGKREKVMRFFFGGDKTPVKETQPSFATDKVKLSNGKAKGLAKKYKNIDCLEERTYQVLLDLNMVGKA
jgi:hypothetical protein